MSVKGFIKIGRIFIKKLGLILSSNVQSSLQLSYLKCFSVSVFITIEEPYRLLVVTACGLIILTLITLPIVYNPYESCSPVCPNEKSYLLNHPSKTCRYIDLVYLAALKQQSPSPSSDNPNNSSNLTTEL